MDYRETLALVVNILAEMLGTDVNASTQLDKIISEKGQIVDGLIAAIKARTGIVVKAEEIRDCKVVRDLALRVQQLSDRQETRVQLSPSRVEEPEVDGSIYPVWFGTNRRPTKSAEGKLEFSSQRDTAIHVGQCNVLVPKSHKIGSLGSSLWKRFLGGEDDRLRLVSIEELAVDAYWRAISGALKIIDVDDRDALIFVHGYNVSFMDAALRAAQIGYDLSVKGAMTFFSWPSQGATTSYMADEATIEASELAITQYLVDVAKYSGAHAVHIIAHSMGNRGVLRAISRIAANAEQRSRVHFDQIILAAPDVDVDVFRELCGAYARVSARTTLYVSAKDRAVEASGWLHEYPRVGLTPPICIASGIDTVNVTNADLTMLGHGYVAEARDVLRDMHSLITHRTPPDRRFGLRTATTEQGEQFWIVGA